MAAGEAGLGQNVLIRRMHDLDGFRETLALQQEVWGFADAEKIPARLFVVVDKIGGFTLGAYDGERLIGYSLAMPGRKPDGRSFLHSHMTGLLPEYQDRRLGRALKLRQREEALRLGVELIEWTFDPLETRNCFFNFEKLGVVARRYEPNLYGVTTSRLHGGLPTDRLVAEWYLRSDRTVAAVERNEPPPRQVGALIPAPAEAAALRQSDPAAARALQEELRTRFAERFVEGLAVVGYRRTPEGDAFELGALSFQPD